MTGETGQAQLIRDLYASLGGRIQAIFFYELRDTIVFEPGGVPVKRVYWGLMNRGLTRAKLGYTAFRAAESSDPPFTPPLPSRAGGRAG
jgi:hypothetical protein